MFIKPIVTKTNKTTFGAGRTIVYSDFDKTYTPFSQAEMCKNSDTNEISRKKEFKDYFSRFKTLKDLAKDKFTLAITTGRNSSEYIFVEKKLKENNLEYFAPEILISGNGADRYIKKDNEWIIDDTKNTSIQTVAKGWNAAKIKNTLKQMFSKNVENICFVLSGVNRTKWDYPGISVEDELEKVSLNDRKNYVSFNKEQNIIDIAFSNSLPVEKLKTIAEKFLQNNKIEAEINHYSKDNNGYCPQYTNGTLSYEPGNRIIIKPKINNKELSKLYDVKEAVKKVITEKTDDLIIAAGDEFNDEEMLNPLNYLDLLGVKYDKNKPLKEILNDANLLKAINKLPLKIIIVGQSPSLSHLREMNKILRNNGIDKISCINSPNSENAGLLNEIQKSILKYSDENDEFSYHLDLNLYKYLVHTTTIY